MHGTSIVGGMRCRDVFVEVGWGPCFGTRLALPSNLLRGANDPATPPPLPFSERTAFMLLLYRLFYHIPFSALKSKRMIRYTS
jgi:hypothetical protein